MLCALQEQIQLTFVLTFDSVTHSICHINGQRAALFKNQVNRLPHVAVRHLPKCIRCALVSEANNKHRGNL